MKLESMRIFAEVVQRGGFTQAADYLNVSKGYVSQKVKALEEEVHKQLLVRNTRTMRLTTAGSLVYEQAKKLTYFFEETLSLLEDSENIPAGLIKITSPVAVSQHLLWPVLSQLSKDHEGLRFYVDCGNTLRNLVEHNYDLAIRLTDAPPVDMVARKLREVQYRCVASPDYLAANGTPTAPSDLFKHRLVALEHWKNWMFYDNDSPTSIKFDTVLSSTDNDTLKRACISGVGIGRFPEYMIKPELESGELVEVLGSFKSESKSLYLVYPHINERPTRVKLTIQHLVDHLTR